MTSHRLIIKYLVVCALLSACCKQADKECNIGFRYTDFYEDERPQSMDLVNEDMQLSLTLVEEWYQGAYSEKWCTKHEAEPICQLQGVYHYDGTLDGQSISIEVNGAYLADSYWTGYVLRSPSKSVEFSFKFSPLRLSSKDETETIILHGQLFLGGTTWQNVYECSFIENEFWKTCWFSKNDGLIGLSVVLDGEEVQFLRV